MKLKQIKVWVDVGSHDGVFEFTSCGPVGTLYPNLMHVYSKQVIPTLVPATLTYETREYRAARRKPIRKNEKQKHILDK